MSYSEMNAKLNTAQDFFATIKDRDEHIPKLGFMVTGSYAFSVFKRHHLSLGFGFANWNGAHRKDAIWANDPTIIKDLYTHYHTRELSIPISFWFYSKGNNRRFFVKTGISPSYLVGFKGHYGDKESNYGLLEEHFTKLNVTAHLALGVEKKISEKLSVFVAPTIHRYFLTDKSQFLIHEMRRSGLGLELGMNYTLKKKKVIETF